MAKWLGILAILALFFGCTIRMDVDQAVNRDGSSLVKEETDLSGLIAYAKTASGSSAIIGGAPKPDDSYSPAGYAGLPSLESAGLGIEITPSSLEKLAPGKSASISAAISNLGSDEVGNVTVRLFSRALVSSGSAGSPVYARAYYPLGAGKAATLSFGGLVANVTPGTHQFTLVANYDRGAVKNLTAAKTFAFTVRSAEADMQDSVDKMEAGYRETCANATRKDPLLKCAYSGGKLTFEKTIMPGEAYAFKAEQGFFESSYNVTIASIPELGASGLGGEAAGSGPQKFADGPGNAAMMQSFLKISYTVHMPGKILSAPLGKISEDGSSVAYDAWELYGKKQNIGIFSREENQGNRMLAMGAAALAVAAALAGAYFLFARKPKQPSPPSQPPQQSG